MRWEQLFADLEGQWAFEQAADSRSARLQSEQVRRQALTVHDRLAALARGDRSPITVGVGSGRVIRLVLQATGADWVGGRLGEAGISSPTFCLVPVSAISSLVLSATQESASMRPVPAQRASDRPTTMQQALRDLSRRRLIVDVHTQGSSPRGSIRRVAADHLDVGQHDETAIGPVSIRIVPLRQIEVVVWSSARG